MILPKIIDEIITKIQNAGFEAFVVGGCVRDFLRGEAPCDWDITTSAKPSEILEIFSDFKTYSQGIKHGTVGIFSNGETVEVTTYRIDGKYSDNRHPEEVIFSEDIKEDLKRRDFTINAMAFNPKCGVLDLFLGKDDLEKKIIRTVGDPDIRFKEDALRILRALRFSAVLGFDICPEAQSSILKNQSLLKDISKERILLELSKLLLADNPYPVLFEYEAVFVKILGIEIKSSKWQENIRILSQSEKLLPIRLALLLDGFCIGEVLKSLRFDNETIQKASLISEFLHQKFETSPCFVKKQLSKIGPTDFSLVLKAKKALGVESLTNLLEIEGIFEEILKKNQCFSVNQLMVNGNDLKAALGLTGKEIGHALNMLLDAVICEKCKNTKNELLQYAKKNE